MLFVISMRRYSGRSVLLLLFFFSFTHECMLLFFSFLFHLLQLTARLSLLRFPTEFPFARIRGTPRRRWKTIYTLTAVPVTFDCERKMFYWKLTRFLHRGLLSLHASNRRTTKNSIGISRFTFYRHVRRYAL